MLNHVSKVGLPLSWGKVEENAICTPNGYVIMRSNPNEYGLTRDQWDFMMHAANNYEILVEALQRCMTEYVGGYDNEHFICETLIKVDELSVNFSPPFTLKKFNEDSDWIVTDKHDRKVCLIPALIDRKNIDKIVDALDREYSKDLDDRTKHCVFV